MKSTEVEKQPPSRGHKHICVPFESEAHYQGCVEDVAKYREYLTKLSAQHPELFPQAIGGGDTLHHTYPPRKQQGVGRRVTNKGRGGGFPPPPPPFISPPPTATPAAGPPPLFSPAG